uniref:F-box-like family protein n=1 Tax=Pithovirus LCPAC401 TaxID=2506595 RepID=A0A481Z9Q7_9VIRU|nr:MAG: uncharacterized protein LCPAC401_02660 [Pithovirus LCPAC401]
MEVILFMFKNDIKNIISRVSKMASVNEILNRLRLKKDLSSTEIQEILSDLNTDEIAILCRTDKRFDTVCQRESFWKNRVTSQYGVDNPILGKTWRDTARIFFQSNMIDLGKEWVNGMTYKELIEEAYDRGYESLMYLNHLKNEKLSEILEMKIDSLNFSFYIEDEGTVAEFIMDMLENDDERFKLTQTVLTKELGVIAAAVAIRYFSYPELPGVPGQGEIEAKHLSYATYTGDQRKYTDTASVNIDEMFEYIPYIVAYSNMNDESLMNYITPDVGGSF